MKENKLVEISKTFAVRIIELGENHNLPKSEDARQPQCPKEKEDAIMEALSFFGMI